MLSRVVLFGCVCSLVVMCSSTLPAAESYPLHPDAQRRDGVLAGEIVGPLAWNESAIYPGTVRNYWVYVPAQYAAHVEAGKKACVCVVQDGLGKAKNLKLPTVFDNLIHEGAMPVTVGIFIEHGRVPPRDDVASDVTGQPRFNRSFEYDSVGDRYARFLLEEILPEVSKTYDLSSDPNDRMILGSSSGAVCAWTVAWERPDEFRRVFSAIGTYVGLRGANEYPTLIRKFEPKPIRVFLQDGSNDLDIYAGSWWRANQSMLASLQWADYDVKHVWGEGGHNGKHAAAVFPDAVRWLWRDYPEPIQAGHAPKRRTDVLIEGEDWQLVSDGHGFTEGPAVGPDGLFYFADLKAGMIYRVDHDDNVTPFSKPGQIVGPAGTMWGPDGNLYVADAIGKKLLKLDTEGEATVILEDSYANDLVCVDTGFYYTDTPAKKVWHVTYDGERTLACDINGYPNGLIPTADGKFMWVSNPPGRFVHHFAIAPEGKLIHEQEYGYVHCDPHVGRSRADGLTVDTEGRMYLGTPLGVQVFDQLGRVHLVLRSPNGQPVANVVFAGPDRDILYGACGNAVYKRKLNATGVIPWEKPVATLKPGL